VYVSRWSRQNESTPAGVLVIGGVDVAFRVDLLFARKVPYCDARTAVERVSGALRLGGLPHDFLQMRTIERMTWFPMSVL
jgi:hypothetical protein